MIAADWWILCCLARETLEKPPHSRDNSLVIAGKGWVHGRQAAGFGDDEQSTAKKRTKREKFLAGVEAVVPWKALINLIEPPYPKASKKGGRPPYPLAT
jgi:hypothetical protein